MQICNKVKYGVSCGGNVKETTRISKKWNSDRMFKRTVTLLECTKKGCDFSNDTYRGN